LTTGTVLVTGATGFLGPHVVERLIAHGVGNVRCLVRPFSDCSKLEQIKKLHPQAILEYSVGSMISCSDLSRALRGVGLIYHLAAAFRGIPADMYRNTVVGSKNLIQAMGTQPRKVVLVSSMGVYGTAFLKPNMVIDEDAPLEDHPEKRDVYSQTKLRQERLFHEWGSQQGHELITLRPGFIYGPDGTALCGRLGLQLPGLFLNLGGSNLLPLSYVDNCAEAIALVGMHAHSAGQVYNVHDDDLCTASEYLRQYRRVVRPSN
jgi:nucleoside-diphosphate-sugar epimerase